MAFGALSAFFMTDSAAAGFSFATSTFVALFTTSFAAVRILFRSVSAVAQLDDKTPRKTVRNNFGTFLRSKFFKVFPQVFERAKN